MLLYCVFLSLLAVACCMNTHQFHFSGGNVAYGNLPRSVHIVGFWYVHPNNTNFQTLKDVGYSADQLRGTLYVCRRDVEKKLVLVNAAERSKAHKVNRIFERADVSLVTPFIDVTECEPIDLVDHAIHRANRTTVVKRFDIKHEYESHGPLLFVDPWGVAAFHYRAKQSDALKLQYCENDDASFPVIFNKRPVCPRPALGSTLVDDGKVTLYKPNIQSVQKKAFQCYVETTYIETYSNFLSGKSNNLPLSMAVRAMDDPEMCRRWMATRVCDLIGYRFETLVHFDNRIVDISDTRMATKNKIKIEYDWLRKNTYTIANCVIDSGYIRTTPPFKSMLTPWGYVPSDNLYASHYRRAGGEMIVWEAFDRDETCNYVPISSIDAKKITYSSKDFLEQDPHPGATEMYHFVSDADKSVYTSDDTQISDVKNYNCIANDTGQTLYAINNGMIVAWQKGGSIYEDDDDDVLDDVGARTQTVYHPHFAYNELTLVQTPENDTTITAVPGGSDGSGDGDRQQCADDDGPGCRQTYVQSSRSSDDAITDSNLPRRARKLRNPGLSNENATTPLFAVVSYLSQKFAEYQNSEVIRRAQAWCENQQHLYDMQLLLARISPSVVIASYLNRPSYSQSIGTGVFHTHYCSIVEEFIVAGSLFVNNTAVAPRMRGKTYRELYEAAGVKVDARNLCFTMPIVIFKERPGQLEYRIGQLHHDQTISTIAMPWIEECKFERYFFHVIGSEVHVFEDYERLSVTSLDKLYDHALRLERNVDLLEKLGRDENVTRDRIEPLLENTQFIDIYTKYEPKLAKPVVLGFKETESYSYKQKRKIISSFEDILAHINSARYDDKLLVSATTGDTSQMSGVVDSVSSGVKVIVDGIGDSVSYVIDSAGGFIDSTLNTAGDSLGNVADFVSGGFVKILIVVASVAVAALFVYYMIKHKLLAEDSDAVQYNNPIAYQHASMPFPPPYESVIERTPGGMRKRNQEATTYAEF
jgi:hypothetical protein